MNTYFPIDFTSPYKLGCYHLKNGFRRGDVLECALGILEMVPIYNYLPANNERMERLNTPEKIMDERGQALKHEISSEGVILQQLYFEIHNSSIPSTYRTYDVSTVFDNSLPDRQLAILINLLDTFIQTEKSTCKELDQAFAILKRAEPFASLITCIMLEPTAKMRGQLKEKLILEIVEQLSNLNEGEVFIIPYGYSNKDCHDLLNPASPGHMTLLEIKKSDANRAEIRLFNTGEGADSDSPWVKMVPFPDLSSQAYWRETIGTVMGRDASMKKANEQIKKLPCEENRAPTPQKSYRTQYINSCSKKSLQVWLHDMLKEQPTLYQKFRLFALDTFLTASKSIVKQKGNGKSIWIDHSIALWGGSDNIQNFLHNSYFKLRGFISGPKVKFPIQTQDLKHMLLYASHVKLAREARLKAREGDLEGGMVLIKNSGLPIFYQTTLLLNLKKFCLKHQLKFDPKQFYLDEQIASRLFSKEGIEEIQTLYNLTPDSSYETYHRTALDKILATGLTLGHIQKSTDFAYGFVPKHEDPLYWLLKQFEHNLVNLTSEERELFEKEFDSLVPEIRETQLRTFATILFTYNKQKAKEFLINTLHNSKMSHQNQYLLVLLIKNGEEDEALKFIDRTDAEGAGYCYIEILNERAQKEPPKQAIEALFPVIWQYAEACGDCILIKGYLLTRHDFFSLLVNYAPEKVALILNHLIEKTDEKNEKSCFDRFIAAPLSVIDKEKATNIADSIKNETFRNKLKHFLAEEKDSSLPAIPTSIDRW